MCYRSARNSNGRDTMVGEKLIVCCLNCYALKKEVGLRSRVVFIAAVAGLATLIAACDTGHDPIPLARAAYVQRAASIAPDTKKEGVYVNEADATSLLGYSQTNRKISPPICTAPCGIDSAHDVAVDNAGNVILVEATGQVSIGQGPKMCGARVATITNPFGAGVNASSADASNGPIAV
jgi:hypothetical protein